MYCNDEWNKKGNDGSGHIRWSPLPGHNWNNWLRLGRFLKYQPPARQSLLVVTIRLCLQLWCVLRDLVTECGPVGATSLGPFHLLPPRLAGRRLSKNPTLVIRHLSSGQIHLNIEYSTAYKPTLLITCSNSQLLIFFMIDFTLFRLRVFDTCQSFPIFHSNRFQPLLAVKATEWGRHNNTVQHIRVRSFISAHCLR